MKDQLEYTEEILFNNYMVSSLGEEFVHSQIPFYFDDNTLREVAYYAEEINRIALEILEGINDIHKELFEYFDEFPYREKIFSLECSLSPMFWTRFDTFRDRENRIYFAELNYDKPCGQKEMDLAGKASFKGNINRNFKNEFKENLIKICEEFSKDGELINVGILMDPCHYEEFHHSYYFKDIFKDTNINIVQIGPKNLSVIKGEVYAFSNIKIPILLRLFPTEFFYEIENIDEILEAFNKNKVLIINDPRIIGIQAKGFFAYLWKLIKEDSNLISKEDKEIIKNCIPYTKLLENEDIKNLEKNKDIYVVKSSLGRYSEEVYIGKSFKGDTWKIKISEVIRSKKIHVIQDLIRIREEYTYIPEKNNMNIPTIAYGNFGVYLIKDKVQGFLVRWSKGFLTDDNYTWMCPLGVMNLPMVIEEYTKKNRKEIWTKIMEEVSFKYNFTGDYTNIFEYVSLDSLIINRNLYEEINYASYKFIEILKKTYPYIQKNLELFGPILGIPEKLYKLVSTSCTSALCAIGRIDFAMDNEGNIKIFEFNSETPAGLVESIGISSIIKKELNIKYLDPNINLRKNIKRTFSLILDELKRKKEIKNIAVVTSWYYEDIYTSEIILNILKEFKDYNVILGNVYDLKVKDNNIFLYNEKIDCIYRHYPLDWFYYEEEMNELIEPLSKGDYLINPAHTLITQSKAFLAIIHELIGKGFFSYEEEEFILQYIPYTSLEPDEKLSSDCIVKPYLSREGLGVIMSYESVSKEIDEVIFQDRVNIRPFNIKIHSTMESREKYQFPVIGSYVANDEVSGIYTRMGDFITNSNSIYIPTFIK